MQVACDETTAVLEPRVDVAYGATMLDRTSRLLSRAALDKLRACTVLIAGCGGVGGGVAMTMARLGVGRFVLADPGRFDPPDANRQWGADLRSLGRNKSDVYQDILATINPQVDVQVFREGVTEDSVARLVEEADVVIDCLDVSVDVKLRAKMFALARARGIYSITAPVLGFGTLLAVASPTGMSMDAYLQPLMQTGRTSKLPGFLREFFAPQTVQAIERDLHTGKVPSLSIGPVLASGLVCTEVLSILLGDLLEPRREPICLPKLVMIDAMMARYRIASLMELAACDTQDTPVEERARRLQAASFNPSRLPAPAIDVDMVTDSWGELGNRLPEPPVATSSAEDNFKRIYGCPHVLAVSRGRFAEGLLAAALIKPGSRVAGNGLFPSTRFHIESRGATVIDVTSNDGVHAANADLDLDRLKAVLDDQPGLTAVWLEPCNNALGGVPVSLANLQAVQGLCRPRGVLVVLDATRLIDNAVLLDPERPQEMLRALVACSDACTVSAMKDFRVRAGGFIATQHEPLFNGLRDLTLAFGSGLQDPDQLAAALQADPFPLVRERVARVSRLHRRLLDAGVPVVQPAGGHAVLIDVARLLPHLHAGQYPVQALAGALFVRTGVRGGENFLTPRQREAGRLLLRLAWPIGCHDESISERIVDVLAEIRARPGQVGGLKLVSQPPGAFGSYFAAFEKAPGS